MGKPDADVNFDKAYGNLSVVHIITGPVGVEGAEPGDKIRIDILDITPLDRGFTMADTPLGFMDNVQGGAQAFGNAVPPGGVDSYRAWCWWDHGPEGWTSPTFPDVVVPCAAAAAANPLRPRSVPHDDFTCPTLPRPPHAPRLRAAPQLRALPRLDRRPSLGRDRLDEAGAPRRRDRALRRPGMGGQP